MITRMAKIEILGPKEQLMAVLKLLRGRGVFQPDPTLLDNRKPLSERPKGILLDDEEIRNRLFLEQLHQQIRQLIALWPEPTGECERLNRIPRMEILDELVQSHLSETKALQQQQEERRLQLEKLRRDLAFWQALTPLLQEVPEDGGLELFGVTIRDPGQLATLREALDLRLKGRCEIITTRTTDNQLIGLVAAEKQMAEQLRTALTEEQVPEQTLPEELATLPHEQKVKALEERAREVTLALHALAQQIDSLAKNWSLVYRQALAWLEERLALYQATALAFETQQCFVIEGWTAAAEVEGLRQELSRQYGGEVVVEEHHILHKDLDRVPVLLRNPPLFAPFELFSRLLPLPKYSSYDPTPFIGLFFPVLFGMILGDIGYGLILFGLAVWLVKSCRFGPLLVDLGKILGLAAGYTILFGLLFGELFGDLGSRRLGLEPIWIDRGHAIQPMIIFVLSVGLAHVLLGLALGIWSELRRHRGREALVKLLTLVLALLTGLTLVAWALPSPWLALKPLLIGIVILLPVLIAAGGLLAPLELLKTIGNIISYVRIMAIGLSSVLLAVVANRLGGMTGDILAGVLVAGILHGFNLILGIFAPTVHSLRLHYVEFFSKFLDLGGRHFEPMKRTPDG